MNRGLDRQEAGRKAGHPAEGEELFAIVQASTGRVLWSGVVLPYQAENKAVIYAVNSGNVNLLSGRDLGAFLLDADRRLSPTHALERTWKPGERVELVSGGYGGRPQELRPGTVKSIDRSYGYHESLVVAFDDGETRSINPDVMRHVRDQKEKA